MIDDSILSFPSIYFLIMTVSTSTNVTLWDRFDITS